MPPVRGLLQPTLVRLALEKLEPAKGPAEKMRGLAGDSGSTVAAPASRSFRAIRYRPALTTASPVSSLVVTVRSSSLISRYLRMDGSWLGCRFLASAGDPAAPSDDVDPATRVPARQSARAERAERDVPAK